MLQVPLRKIGSRINGFQSHFSHIELNCLTVQGKTIAKKLLVNPPVAVKRILGENFVNTVFERNFSLGRLYWLVIQTGAADAQQLSLPGKRKRSFSFNCETVAVALYQGHPV